MSSVNKVIIVGRIGRDPEVRYTQTGQQVASFSVATDESYKGKDGQKVEATEWHSITAWGKTAEFVGNYLGKGRMVYVEGKLKTEKYTGKDGSEKYATKIIADRVQALDKRTDGQPAADHGQGHDESKHFPTDASGIDDAPF